MVGLFESEVVRKTQPLCYGSHIHGFSLCERIPAWILRVEKSFSADEKLMVKIINLWKQKLSENGGG